MRCEEAVDRIDLYLTGDLSTLAGIRLRHHLFRCRRCYAELRRAREVHGVVGDYVTHLRPEGDLSSRVMKRIADVSAPVTPVLIASRRPARAARWIAIAAMLLLAVSLGVIAWLVRSNRAATSDILARVSELQGRAFYVVPGGSEPIPLEVNVVVPPGSRVETPEDGSTALMSGDGKVRIGVGGGGEISVRRGTSGVVIDHAKGPLLVEADEGTALERVIVPGGSIVPSDDGRVSFEITSTLGFPETARKVKVDEGKVEARSEHGALEVQEQQAISIDVGKAPEVWAEPTEVAAEPTRTSSPANEPVPEPIPEKSKPTSKTMKQISTSAEAVSALVTAAEVLAKFARENDGSTKESCEPLLQAYQAAHDALVARGPDALPDILRAYRKRSTILNEATSLATSGPLAECADEIARAALSNPAAVHSVEWAVRSASSDATLREALCCTLVWQGRSAILSLADLPADLLTMGLDRKRDVEVRLAALRSLDSVLRTNSTWPSCLDVNGFKNRLVAAYPTTPDEAGTVGREIVRLLTNAGDPAPFEKLVESARGIEETRRIQTYRDYGLLDRERAVQEAVHPVLHRFVEDPVRILREGLDPEAALDILLRTTWRNGATLNKDWENALFSALDGKLGPLGATPGEEVRRLAAIAIGRADGDVFASLSRRTPLFREPVGRLALVTSAEFRVRRQAQNPGATPKISDPYGIRTTGFYWIEERDAYHQKAITSAKREDGTTSTSLSPYYAASVIDAAATAPELRGWGVLYSIAWWKSTRRGSGR